MVPFTDDAGDNHLHVVGAAVAPGPGRHVEGAGGGDKVVVLRTQILKTQTQNFFPWEELNICKPFQGGSLFHQAWERRNGMRRCSA